MRRRAAFLTVRGASSASGAPRARCAARLARLRAMATAPAAQGACTDTGDAKRALRAAVRARLGAKSGEALAEQGAAAAARARASSAWRGCRSACVYVASTRLREVDTAPLLDDALRVAPRPCFAPRVVGETSDGQMRMLRISHLGDLEPGAMGLLEPPLTDGAGSPRECVETTALGEGYDVVLMPGFAFDRAGGRLGRGGGFYDRFVARLTASAAEQGRPPPVLLALCYDEQVVEAVPAHAHDHPVDFIATPTELITCAAEGRSPSSKF